jgi:hypothetical protein
MYKSNTLLMLHKSLAHLVEQQPAMLCVVGSITASRMVVDLDPKPSDRLINQLGNSGLQFPMPHVKRMVQKNVHYVCNLNSRQFSSYTL